MVLVAVVFDNTQVVSGFLVRVQDLLAVHLSHLSVVADDVFAGFEGDKLLQRFGAETAGRDQVLPDRFRIKAI